jgi:urease accessory protein
VSARHGAVTGINHSVPEIGATPLALYVWILKYPDANGATRAIVAIHEEDPLKPRLFPLFVAALLASTPALAHSTSDAGGGFVTGFLHPILGWDHVAAMIAVGLWGAFLGKPAVWLLPVTFPLVMALGGAAGAAGVPIPGIETGIAASALVIGLAVLLAARPPLAVAAIIVAFFAIFHGHAHGTEMPAAISPLAYAAGFVIGTGLLHLCGIAFGVLTRSKAGTIAVRAAGGVIAAAGVGFLTGAL